MGIYKKIVDYDRMFADLTITPTIINDLPNLSDSDRIRNNDLIYSQHSSMFSTTPRCNCGALMEERRIGLICDKCGTPVREVLEGDMEPELWMRPPRGIGVDVFINLGVMQLLSNYFSKSKKPPKDSYILQTTGKPKRAQEAFNPLLWLTCTDYHPKNAETFIEAMKAAGLKRGYSNFVKNLKHNLDTLLNMPQFTKSQALKQELISVLNGAGKAIYCKRLPLIKRELVVVENEAMSRFMDSTVPLAVNAARQLLGIDTPGQELRVQARENRTAKTILGLNHFTMEYGRSNVGSKQGLARKQMFSTRVETSGRAVITSITSPHRYDELHCPWPVAVGMLRTHLQNYLVRFGFTPLEMVELLSYATSNWHPLIESIFKTIFQQSPEKGMTVTFVRNPSLERASIQLLLMSMVKADPSDQSFGFSILSVVGCNADFDGDEMSATLMPDRTMVEMFEPLKPHKSAHSITNYRTMSGNFAWSKPVVSTISAAVAAHDDRMVSDEMEAFAV